MFKIVKIIDNHLLIKELQKLQDRARPVKKAMKLFKKAQLTICQPKIYIMRVVINLHILENLSYLSINKRLEIALFKTKMNIFNHSCHQNE